MNEDIAGMIGQRVRQYRLNRNITQAKLARESSLSETAIKKAEKGDSTLSTYIKILTVLGKEENLLAAFPDEGESPVQLMKNQGKVKQRAREKTSHSPAIDAPPKEELDW
jgi:transcriptional regulator with XRE-family HTH domain